MSIVNYKIAELHLKECYYRIVVGYINSVRGLITDLIRPKARDPTVSKDIVDLHRLLKPAIVVERAAKLCRAILYSIDGCDELHLRAKGLGIEVASHEEDRVVRADVADELCRGERARKCSYVIGVHVVNVEGLVDTVMLEEHAAIGSRALALICAGIARAEFFGCGREHFGLCADELHISLFECDEGRLARTVGVSATANRVIVGHILNEPGALCGRYLLEANNVGGFSLKKLENSRGSGCEYIYAVVRTIKACVE